ncbi:MAG: class I SAM-dependent methyltransferase [Anaerolineales bacterium]|jgi:ubiquinone/menaquinone biosynthesis C-methylase UbiE
MDQEHPPICNYEGSDYQTTFWDQGGREYEDRVEAIALGRLLPKHGQRMIEVGAGAGRNTPRYVGFKQIVLFDYSRTQLEQAQDRLGRSDRFVYVVGDVYRLPFAEAAFDAATMIRTLHHIAEPERALAQVRSSLVGGSTFILEFANKRNLKAILRYALRRQEWSPFDAKMIEFAPLNFNFHPASVRTMLENEGFEIGRALTVSHFRIALLKRMIPLGWLTALDAALQTSGKWLKLTPSVFVEATLPGQGTLGELNFKCPSCGGLKLDPMPLGLRCAACGNRWGYRDGIYDFKEPLEES